MNEQVLSYEEIVIKIAATDVSVALGDKARVAADDAIETIRSYDAFIYTNLKTDNLRLVEKPGMGQPKLIGNLPLAGVEQVIVYWSHYKKYINAFIWGEKSARNYLRGPDPQHNGPGKVMSELFEVKGTFLKALFTGQEQKDHAVRVWWHSELPELVALPWELMAYRDFSEIKGLFSFVRGLPPETTTPKLPLSGPLRLAFIYDPRITSKALLDAFKNPPPNIEVKHMTGASREALRTAAKEGYELVHLVADGTVSLANEGTLYLRKSAGPSEDYDPINRRILRVLLRIYEHIKSIFIKPLRDWFSSKLEATLDIDKCPPRELSSLLRGSRIKVLSLSAPKSTDTDPDRIDGYLLPKVYQAFASLGSSNLPLPTIVGPVGAVDDVEMTQFWCDFYADVAENLEIPAAPASGQAGGSPLALAVFLRQRDGRFFTRVMAGTRKMEVDPTQLDVALQFSRELVEQLKAQSAQYDSMPESFRKLLAKENERQADLEAKLKPWT